MSLILGVHLPRKIYLVGDTRLTTRKGLTKSYEDDLIKFFSINTGVSAVAAGDAQAAAFILNQLRVSAGEAATITDFENNIKVWVEKGVKKYVEESKRHRYDLAFIIGGFDKGREQEINSTTFGEIASLEPRQIEGKTFHQDIDMIVMSGLAKYILKHGEAGANTVFTAELPYSKIIGVEAHIYPTYMKIETKLIGCYEAIINHPDQSTKQITLPPDIVSRIEFGKRASSAEDQVYSEALKLVVYALKLAEAEGFDSVGGNFLPFLRLPDHAYIPTAELFRKQNDGTVVKIGGYENVNGMLQYENKDGSSGIYRSLATILAEKGEMEI